MNFILLANVPSFIKTCNKYNINTPLRLAHFFAQLAHESAYFTVLQENLNYSASGLLEIFGNYFNSTTANAYARQPQKIANRVYANRMGNGNEASGDGWKYRGRGYIQLTGKANYQAYKNFSKIDVVKNPDLLLNSSTALDVAGWFWSSKNINTHADKDDITTVTKLINGGTNGLQDRINKLKTYKTIDLISLLTQKKKWWYLIR